MTNLFQQAHRWSILQAEHERMARLYDFIGQVGALLCILGTLWAGPFVVGFLMSCMLTVSCVTVYERFEAVRCSRAYRACLAKVASLNDHPS